MERRKSAAVSLGFMGVEGRPAVGCAEGPLFGLLTGLEKKLENRLKMGLSWAPFFFRPDKGIT